MNDNQRLQFHHIVNSCAAGGFSSINVASKVRSDAIVAASIELELLGLECDQLLAACKALLAAGESGMMMDWYPAREQARTAIASVIGDGGK